MVNFIAVYRRASRSLNQRRLRQMIDAAIFGLMAFGFVLLVVGLVRMLKPVGRVLSDWEEEGK